VRDHGVEPRIVHAANSAATILYPEAHFDLVRIGIALYGLDPGGALGERAGLRPALSWRSEVSSVRSLPAGELVSYGHRYGVAGGVVATVPVGYADGYRRGLSGRAEVLIGGRRGRRGQDRGEAGAPIGRPLLGRGLLGAPSGGDRSGGVLRRHVAPRPCRGRPGEAHARVRARVRRRHDHLVLPVEGPFRRLPL